VPMQGKKVKTLTKNPLNMRKENLGIESGTGRYKRIGPIPLPIPFEEIDQLFPKPSRGNNRPLEAAVVVLGGQPIFVPDPKSGLAPRQQHMIWLKQQERLKNAQG